MSSLVITAIVVVLLIPLSVFAQESYITVQTDDNHYDEGDTIVISGTVTTIIGNTPATLQLFSEGNLIDIALITVAQDGSFSHTVIAEGPLWKEQGDYTVRVSYGEGNIAESEFSYTPTVIGSASGSIEKISFENFELEIELPVSDGEEFGIYATKNQINNFERLMNIIRDSSESERILEEIILDIEQNKNISGQDVNAVTRFTSDGIETLEYGILWTTFRAHNDILSDGRQVLELMKNGMSLDTAINFLGIIPKSNSHPTIPGISEPQIPFTAEVVKSEANSISISLITDKQYYSNGETIRIIGQVTNYSGGKVSMIVTSPDENIVSIATSIIVTDNKFGKEFTAGGPLWKNSGDYVVEFHYGADSSRVLINYVGGDQVITEPEATPEPIPEEPKELGIASFVDKIKDPQSYVDRYNSEPSYKEWFNENYSQYDSIEQAVGLTLTEKIPSWAKNIFGWYAQDKVSEDELLNAIKYLINEKILIVN